MRIKRSSYLKESIDNVHHVAMYGAGTQSTGMILMALNGDFDEVPEFAVFSDTGAEPQHVIEYKEYFAEFVLNEFGFKIYTVSRGNLDQDIKDYVNGKTKRVSQIPLYSDTGIVMRQCTMDYKIAPSDKFIKKKLKINKRTNPKKVGIWMGISVDEFHRMRKSTDWWKLFIYPLIETGYYRNDTVNYVKRFGLKEPPRSACYFCPFHSREYWRYLMMNYPDEFDKAIDFDEMIRNYPKLRKKQYIHQNRIPLKDVDFSQLNYIDMNDECNGYCGI